MCASDKRAMITLYIVRHGQTVDNLEDRIQGHTDSPLTELGVRQAQAIAQRLSAERFHALYSSDLGRAVHTAEIVASPHGLAITTTPLLRELHLGVAQGMTREQFREEYPEACRLWESSPAIHRPPGGETVESAIARCGEFIRQVVAQHGDGEKLAVIAHGGSLKGLIIAAFNLPVGFFASMAASNASLSILEIGERPRLRLFNDTCHLCGLEKTTSDADDGNG